MVKKVQNGDKPPLSICEPDHNDLAQAAKQQKQLLEAENIAEKQNVTLDPTALNNPSETFIPATSIDTLLSHAPVKLYHPFFLFPSAHEKLNEAAKTAKTRTNWAVGEEASRNPAARVAFETELASQLVDQLYSNSGLGLSYDKSLQDGLNLQETIDQKRGVCRELTYAFVLEARNAGLNAFFIGVDQFTDGRTPYEVGAGHLLAGVLLSDGSVIQVDPTSGAVDEKNCEVHFLSDQEVVSEYLSTKASYTLNRQDPNASFYLSQQAIELDPSNASAQLTILQTAGFENQNEAAAAWLKLGRDFPGDPQIQFAVGQFMGVYSPHDAINYLNRAIELSAPVAYTEAFIEKAKAYKALGEEQVDQVILAYLDGLNHEPHNPRDAFHLDIHSQIFVTWLEKNKANLDDVEISWQGRDWDYEEILAKAKEVKTNHEIPLSKKPEMAHWLFEHGHLDDAEYFIISYLDAINKSAAANTSEDQAADMTLLKGEIAYTKNNTDSAKHIWNRAPYKDKITAIFQQQFQAGRFPGTQGFYKAKMAAEKLYLMDPKNTSARNFLALVDAQEGNERIEIPDNAETLILKKAVELMANYDAKNPEGLKTLEEVLKNDIIDTDDTLLFLEHFYLDRQDVESLRILDDFFQRHPGLRFPSVPDEVLAIQAEGIARLFAKQTDPQDKQRALRFFHVAASHQQLGSYKTFWDAKVKLFELSQAKARLTGDFNFVDQDTISYFLNELIKADASLPDKEMEFFGAAHEASLAYLDSLKSKDPTTTARMTQVFNNRISTVILSASTAENSPDKKAQTLLSTVDEKKRLCKKYKIPFKPFNISEQKAIVQHLIVLPGAESGLENLNFQHLPGFLKALDDSVKVFEGSSNLDKINKLTLAFLIDGQARQPEIELLLQQVAESLSKDSYEFEDDIIGNHPKAPFIPHVADNKLSYLTAAHFILAEKISTKIGRPDLAQFFKETKDQALEQDQ